MRTIEEIKDKVAQDNGYKDWEYVHAFEVDALVNECMKEAQKEAVNELHYRHDECNGIDQELVDELLKEIDQND